MDPLSSPPQTVRRPSHLFPFPLARAQERGHDLVARRLGTLVFLHDQERNWCGVCSLTLPCFASVERPRENSQAHREPFKGAFLVRLF